MPVLENRKQELYAQGLARGEPQMKAYENAGYKPLESAASRLASQVKVLARVRELQAASAERAEVTAAELSDQLEDIRKKALEANQMGAAAQAVMGRAKLHGLIIDKAEVKDVTPIDPAARQAEIDRLLAKRGGHLRVVS